MSDKILDRINGTLERIEARLAAVEVSPVESNTIHIKELPQGGHKLYLNGAEVPRVGKVHVSGNDHGPAIVTLEFLAESIRVDGRMPKQFTYEKGGK